MINPDQLLIHNFKDHHWTPDLALRVHHEPEPAAESSHPEELLQVRRHRRVPQHQQRQGGRQQDQHGRTTHQVFSLTNGCELVSMP